MIQWDNLDKRDIGQDKYYERYEELTMKFEEFYDKNKKMQDGDYTSASEVTVEVSGRKTPSRVSSYTHILPET